MTAPTITIRYTHTTGRTLTVNYEQFDDGWVVEVHDPHYPDDPALYFDDWSGTSEPDPTASIGRILAHYLNVPALPHPWHSISSGPVTVTRGGAA